MSIPVVGTNRVLRIVGRDLLLVVVMQVVVAEASKEEEVAMDEAFRAAEVVPQEAEDRRSPTWERSRTSSVW